MNIPVADLKRFQRLASSIKTPTILPILSYVRASKGKLTKTALNSFVQLDCSAIDTDLLLDEKLLVVKINNTAAPVLTITQKGNKVTITDSITPTTFQTGNIKEYPAIPEATSERFKVGENFLSVLSKASNFVNNVGTIPSKLEFVMVGNGFISASNGQILFSEPVDEGFQLVIEKKNAATISKLPITEYAFSDAYMFFYGEGLTIGFSISEIGFMDLTKYANMESAKREFTASANDIQHFNTECCQSSRLPWVTIKSKELVMNDKDYDVHLERPMDSLSPSENFTYNAELMNRLLTSIEADEIEFYRGASWYWIKSPDHKFTTLIMRIETIN